MERGNVSENTVATAQAGLPMGVLPFRQTTVVLFSGEMRLRFSPVSRSGIISIWKISLFSDGIYAIIIIYIIKYLFGRQFSVQADRYKYHYQKGDLTAMRNRPAFFAAQVNHTLFASCDRKAFENAYFIRNRLPSDLMEKNNC